MKIRFSFFLTGTIFAALTVMFYFYSYNGKVLKSFKVNRSEIRNKSKEKCWLPKRTSRKLDLVKMKRKFMKQNGIQKDTKIILLYTGLFFHPWWWGKNENSIQKYTYENNCEVKSCFFTYNKEAIRVADVVVFHGVDLNKAYCIKKLSNARSANQKWLFFMHESPMYTQNLKEYNGIFNWTMTYMRKSDIFVPYFSYKKISKRNRQKESTDFSNGKTGKVVWVVSHCGLLRDDYVLELEKYIDVDVYGDCSHKFKKSMGRCNEWGTICENELRNYKFYLSFENCFCKDYITEKFWEKGLMYGLIPIVMGAIDKNSQVIKGSYIDVNDFESIEKLSKYLLYLDNNSTAYNEFFKWRYKFEIVNKVDSLCEVCKAAHDETRKNKIYENIDEFWSRKQNCDPYSWKIDQIRKQISMSKFEYNKKRTRL